MANPNYYYHGYLVMFSCAVLLTAQIGASDGAGSLLGGKKLIVGVPKKVSFIQFVDVQLNPLNKSQLVNVTGYSIDIFLAAVAYLQRSNYNISFEFSAFVDKNGNTIGGYDALIRQVNEGKYDAAVADLTIVANRSNYVDFTLPYAQSDVRMLVKLRNDPRLNMWTFVQPFSWDMWLCIVVVSVFTGGIILFMEHNVQEDSMLKNSPIRKQLSGVSILWLPVVQAVFPERGSLAKNCSKFVLVMWLILVFILMQSYTACLSSILTVHQLQSHYPSEDDIITDPSIFVGCHYGSFINGLLVDSLSIDSSRVKEYSSIKQYKEALEKGSRRGGVDAIFDEVPYIKVFLAKYGSNYAMVGPRHRNAGFGFAFCKNSTLTSYFSQAILNVSESKEMDCIEDRYFNTCEDDGISSSSSDVDSPSLTAYSFAGLFVVFGILSLLALLISEHHFWRRHVMLMKMHSQKFLSWSSTRTNTSEEGSRTRINVDDDGEGSVNRENIRLSGDGEYNYVKILVASLP
ncbi:glutamate receptor 2.7-like isoform X2 [Prosopis cineraria]|uniref:glutamate receptor 2.7-like isoform X2 n=1 Tax=Prosopis cineraria TaxID=364024 RepID=UPI0024105197|nr:glutamate receptor 2.7-like isoform X2 [Prosopis cineraria]